MFTLEVFLISLRSFVISSFTNNQKTAASSRFSPIQTKLILSRPRLLVFLFSTHCVYYAHNFPLKDDFWLDLLLPRTGLYCIEGLYSSHCLSLRMEQTITWFFPFFYLSGRFLSEDNCVGLDDKYMEKSRGKISILGTFLIPENELVPILLRGLARRSRSHVIPGFCRRMGGTREVSDPITARGMFCRQVKH